VGGGGGGGGGVGGWGWGGGCVGFLGGWGGGGGGGVGVGGWGARAEGKGDLRVRIYECICNAQRGSAHLDLPRP